MKYSQEELHAALEQCWLELKGTLNYVAELPTAQWQEAGRKALYAYDHEDGSEPPLYKQICRHHFTGEIWVNGAWVLEQ